MRKVALAASAGFVKSGDFNKFWPLPESAAKEQDTFTWGDKEEALKLREQIQKSHGIKLG